MASGFNLTAQLNLKGPTNVSVIVSDIKKQLGSINASVNLTVAPAATTNINKLNAALLTFNKTLLTTTGNANSAALAIRNLGTAIGSISTSNLPQVLNNSVSASTKLAQASANNAKQLRLASSEMTEFGRQAGLAFRRFSAITSVTGVIYGLTNAINSGIRAYIDYDKELVKLQQVTGQSIAGLKGLESTITGLATSLGVGSAELTQVSSTLAQAGLSARDTERALKALALSSLAPSFDSMNETVEGSIALMRQFGINAGDLEKALGSVNSVAAKFAVEAADLITAIQRTGGVFATASKGVSEGTDALNEFLAVFTSIRATTRESAETIATGLRTIFTRIQRGDTISALKEYGVNLQDLDGKFVGAYRAVELLSKGLGGLDPRDLRFSKIVEELGGFRQIGKVIPLIQQFATAQDALKVAQTGQGSLAADATKAQESLAVQIAKVREQFLALFRDIGKSDSFQAIAKGALSVTSALIKAADSIKGILPVLGVMLAFKGASAAVQFGSGFLSGMRGSGGAKGLGNRMGGGPGMNSGGPVRRFASGGLVPGSGDTDSVDAKLMPGEFVMKKAAVNAIGKDALHRMNGYAAGGKVATRSFSIKEFINEKKKTIIDRYLKSDNNKESTLELDDSVKATINDVDIGKPLTNKEIKSIYDTYSLDSMPTLKKMYKQSGSRSSLFVARNAKKLEEKEQAIKNLQNTFKGTTKKQIIDYATITGTAEKAWGVGYEKVILDRFKGVNPASDDPNYPVDTVEILNNNNKRFGDVKFKTTRENNSKLVKKLLSKRLLDGKQNTYFTENKKNDYDEDKNLGIFDYFFAGNDSSGVNQKENFYQRMNYGGLIQKFLKGGTVEETAELEKMSLQDAILAQIKEMGGIKGVKGLLGVPGGQRTLDSLLRAEVIKKKDTLDPTALKAVNDALSNEEGRNIRKAQAINKSQKLAVVGLQPFDKSDEIPFDIPGFDNSTIFVRGLSKKYADAVAGMRQMVEGTIEKFGTDIQNTMVFGGDAPLVLDFDETLVSGADIFGPNGKPDIPSYDDLDKVAKALRQDKVALTPLGEKIKEIVSFDPSFLNRIRVLTARPQSNAGLLSQKLKEFGIPLDANKITGVSGGNKGTAMGITERLIDDNIKNINDAKKAGKSAVQYAELRKLSEEEKAATGNANAEGAILEATLAKLGAVGGSIQNRAVDFENGLGSAAAQAFPGIAPDWPTEVKRTLSSDNIGRAKEEFTRYYAENYGPWPQQEDAFGFDKAGKPVSRFNLGGRVKFAEGGLAQSPKLIQRGGFKYSLDDVIKAGFTEEQFMKQIPAPGGYGEQWQIGGYGEGSIPMPDALKPYKAPPSAIQERVGEALINRQNRIADALMKDGRTARDYEGRTGDEKAWRKNRGYNLGGLIQKFAAGGKVDYYSLEKNSGFKSGEFDLLANFAKTNGFSLDEFKKYLQQRLAQKQQNSGLRMNPASVLRAITPEAPKTTDKQRALADQLKGEPDAGYRPILTEAQRLAASRAEVRGSALTDINNATRYSVGGVAEPEQKKEKQFGKISISEDSGMVSAGYLKNDTRQGYATAYKMRDNLYYVGLSSATSGYGPKLYDVLMEAVTEKGSMLTSDRNVVSGAAKNVWEYYFKNRGDVKKTPLKPSDWTSNSALLDPKLHGKEETWPPATDPAWILQSGYSKSPDLINGPDVVRPSTKPDTRAMALSYFSARTKAFADGGHVMAMLTPGEAVLSPESASQIGKSNLDRLNHAEKYVKRNSGGGISIVPGSGDGDTFGPVPLAVGSYVIRKKATAALGLGKYNVGGSVQKFAAGGMPISIRPEAIGLETIAATVSEIDEIRESLSKLGDEVSSFAKLLARGGQVSYAAMIKASEADIKKLQYAGASIADIVKAEQALSKVRASGQQQAVTKQFLEAGFTESKSGKDLGSGAAQQRILEAATKIEKSITDQRTSEAFQGLKSGTMSSMAFGSKGVAGRSDSEIMVEAKKIANSQLEMTKNRAFTSATGKVTGMSKQDLAGMGISGNDIQKYISQSMMDRKTLSQMDKQLLQLRKEEYAIHGTVKGVAVKSASEAEKLMQQELTERRKIVNATAKAQGVRGPGGVGLKADVANFARNAYDKANAFNETMGLNKFGGIISKYGPSAALSIGALAGQGENITGYFTSDKKKRKSIGSGLESGLSTAASGIGLAASTVAIPVAGPYIAAIVLAGTALMAFSQYVTAASHAAREFEQDMRNRRVEDAGERLDKSLEALGRAPTDAGSQNKVLQDVKNLAVENNSNASGNLKDAQADKAKSSVLARLGLAKAPTLDNDDMTELAKQRAKAAEKAATGARTVIESKMESGQTFEEIKADPGFQELASIIAEANVEFQLAKVRIENFSDATVATTGETKEEMIARNRNAEITKLESDAGLLARSKTLEAARAMDEFNRAGRALAMTFGDMARSFDQALGRVTYELNELANSTDDAIDALSGQAKIGKISSKDRNVLENPDVYDEKTKQETSKRVAEFVTNPNKVGLDPLEKERRQAESAKIEQLLNSDPEKIGRRTAGAVAGVVKDDRTADIATVAPAAKAELMAQTADLPEQMRDAMVRQFDVIVNQVNEMKDATPEQKTTRFAQLLQDELPSAASNTAKAIKDLGIKAISVQTDAFNQFISSVNKAAQAQLNYSEMLNKAKDTRAESSIALREMKSGGSIGLAERESIVNNRVARLTGGETDPNKIVANIQNKEGQRSALQDTIKDASKTEAERIKAIESLANLDMSINKNKQALDELANSTELASAAMDQLQSLQKMQADRLQNLDQVLTSTPQELQKLNQSLIRVQQRAMGINPNPSREAKKAYDMTFRQTGGNRFLAMQAAQGQMAQDRATDLRTMEQYKSNFMMQYMNNNPGSSMEDAENKYKVGSANVRGQMAYESGAINIPGAAQTIMSSVRPDIDPAFARAQQVYQNANDKQAIAQEAVGKLDLIKSERLLKDATDQLAKAFNDLPETFNKAQSSKLEEFGINVAPKPLDDVIEKRAATVAITASTGKYIDFKPQGTDTVPAMLTPGEFVVNARSTAQHLPLLKAINSGTNIVGNTAMMNDGGVVYLEDAGLVPKPKNPLKSAFGFVKSIYKTGKSLMAGEFDAGTVESAAGVAANGMELAGMIPNIPSSVARRVPGLKEATAVVGDTSGIIGGVQDAMNPEKSTDARLTGAANAGLSAASLTSTVAKASVIVPENYLARFAPAARLNPVGTAVLGTVANAYGGYADEEATERGVPSPARAILGVAGGGTASSGGSAFAEPLGLNESQDETASALGSTASTAIAGASIGTVIAGPAGTAAGAAVGAIVGASSESAKVGTEAAATYYDANYGAGAQKTQRMEGALAASRTNAYMEDNPGMSVFDADKAANSPAREKEEKESSTAVGTWSRGGLVYLAAGGVAPKGPNDLLEREKAFADEAAGRVREFLTTDPEYQTMEAERKAAEQKEKDNRFPVPKLGQDPLQDAKKFKMTDAQIYAGQSQALAPKSIKDIGPIRSMADAQLAREAMARGMTIAEVKYEKQQIYLSRFRGGARAAKEKSLGGSLLEPSERMKLMNKAMEAQLRQDKGGDPYADQRASEKESKPEETVAKTGGLTAATILAAQTGNFDDIKDSAKSEAPVTAETPKPKVPLLESTLGDKKDKFQELDNKRQNGKLLPEEMKEFQGLYRQRSLEAIPSRNDDARRLALMGIPPEKRSDLQKKEYLRLRYQRDSFMNAQSEGRARTISGAKPEESFDDFRARQVKRQRDVDDIRYSALKKSYREEGRQLSDPDKAFVKRYKEEQEKQRVKSGERKVIQVAETANNPKNAVQTITEEAKQTQKTITIAPVTKQTSSVGAYPKRGGGRTDDISEADQGNFTRDDLITQYNDINIINAMGRQIAGYRLSQLGIDPNNPTVQKSQTVTPTDPAVVTPTKPIAITPTKPTVSTTTTQTSSYPNISDEEWERNSKLGREKTQRVKLKRINDLRQAGVSQETIDLYGDTQVSTPTVIEIFRSQEKSRSKDEISSLEGQIARLQSKQRTGFLGFGKVDKSAEIQQLTLKLIQEQDKLSSVGIAPTIMSPEEKATATKNKAEIESVRANSRDTRTFSERNLGFSLGAGYQAAGEQIAGGVAAAELGINSALDMMGRPANDRLKPDANSVAVNRILAGKAGQNVGRGVEFARNEVPGAAFILDAAEGSSQIAVGGTRMAGAGIGMGIGATASNMGYTSFGDTLLDASHNELARGFVGMGTGVGRMGEATINLGGNIANSATGYGGKDLGTQMLGDTVKTGNNLLDKLYEQKIESARKAGGDTTAMLVQGADAIGAGAADLALGDAALGAGFKVAGKIAKPITQFAGKGIGKLAKAGQSILSDFRKEADLSLFTPKGLRQAGSEISSDLGQFWNDIAHVDLLEGARTGKVKSTARTVFPMTDKVGRKIAEKTGQGFEVAKDVVGKGMEKAGQLGEKISGGIIDVSTRDLLTRNPTSGYFPTLSKIPGKIKDKAVSVMDRIRGKKKPYNPYSTPLPQYPTAPVATPSVKPPVSVPSTPVAPVITPPVKPPVSVPTVPGAPRKSSFIDFISEKASDLYGGITGKTARARQAALAATEEALDLVEYSDDAKRYMSTLSKEQLASFRQLARNGTSTEKQAKLMKDSIESAARDNLRFIEGKDYLKRQQELIDLKVLTVEEVKDRMQNTGGSYTSLKGGLKPEISINPKRMGNDTVRVHELTHYMDELSGNLRSGKGSYYGALQKQFGPLLDRFLDSEQYEDIVDGLGSAYTGRVIREKPQELITVLTQGKADKATKHLFKERSTAQEILNQLWQARGYQKGGIVYASDGALVPQSVPSGKDIVDISNIENNERVFSSYSDRIGSSSSSPISDRAIVSDKVGVPQPKVSSNSTRINGTIKNISAKMAQGKEVQDIKGIELSENQVAKINNLYTEAKDQTVPALDKILDKQSISKASESISNTVNNISNVIKGINQQTELVGSIGTSGTKELLAQMSPKAISGSVNDGPQYKAGGGIVYASNGTLVAARSVGTDTVPAMLTPGEFVVNRQATQQHMPILQAINSGAYNQGGVVKYLAEGGIVAPQYHMFGGLAKMAGGAMETFAGMDMSAIKDLAGSLADLKDTFGSLENVKSLGDSLQVAVNTMGTNISSFGEQISSIPSQVLHNVSASVTQHVTGLGDAGRDILAQATTNASLIARSESSTIERNRFKSEEGQGSHPDSILGHVGGGEQATA